MVLVANIFSWFCSHLYRLVCLSLLAVWINPGNAQISLSPEINRIIDRGLVFDIHQDRRGFFWFGTEFGLIRYDGYEQKVYQHEPGNTNSLGGNIITCILEDEQEDFWLGTMHHGLQYFDPRKEHFQRFSHDPSSGNGPAASYIKALAQDAEGYIWVGTLGGGLDRFDPATGTFQHFIEQGRGPLSSQSIHDLHIDRDGALWVGAYRGLARWEPDKETFTTFNDFFHQDTLNHIVESISDDREGGLWLGMKGGQLFRFSPEEERFQKIDYQTSRKNPVGRARVWDIIHRSNGELWIGRDRGLQVARLAGGRLIEQDWPERLSGLRGLALWNGPGSLCWVGTDKGVFKVNTGEKKFDCVQPVLDINGATHRPWVTDIAPYDASRLWLGTTLGLFTYHLESGQINSTWNDSRELPLLQGKNIISLCRDSRQNLWMGTLENFGEQFQLWRLNLQTGDLENLTNRADVFQSTPITSITEDSLGVIWLANGLGLARYEYETDSFYRFLPDTGNSKSLLEGGVNKVLVDSRARLWIGTNDEGLLQYKRKEDELKVWSAGVNDPAAISNNRINDITEDSLGNLWVATPGGLNYFDTKAEKFTLLTKEDGLPDNVITGLQWSPDGLWIGTQNGLSHYSSGSFENFKEEDGLQGPEFWHRSAFRDHRGYLYFGGEGGLNVFHPDSLQRNPVEPPVFITDLSLFNEPVEAGDENSPLSKDISYTNEISLDYSQNVITFGYTALNYQHPEKNQFAYLLENFDSDWQYVGDKREITFTNLDPGDYVFRVKASNNDGKWNEAGTAVKLIVHPPWWGTWWARLLFFGVATALLYLFIRMRWQKQLAHQESLRLQEIDALKTELYTNITHEFRTPLTLILGPVEKALQNGSAVVENELEGIRKNGHRLLSLVNQLLQLRRLEAGAEEVNYRHGDVLPLLRYTVDAFESSARQQDIRLKLECPPEPVLMDFDGEKLQDILINLLSNALKFTPSGGQVILRAATTDAQLVIEVEDTGEGIPPSELPKIFDRFHRVKGQQNEEGPIREGTGIGLALVQRLVALMEGTVAVISSPGKGSIFTVRLPIRHESKPLDTPFVPSGRIIPEETGAEAEIKEQEPLSPDYKILIVEDNPEVVRFIAGCLPNGMEALEANEGPCGLELARSEIPDLIISDVMMPGMDGFELTRQLKLDDRTSHIPVILLTARADQQALLEGLEGGADAYLTKPFNPEELQIRIVKMLELRQRLQTYYLKKAGMEWIAPSSPADSEREDNFLKKVMKIIENSIDDASFSIEQLSQEMGMSHAQLHRKMTALTGQSALKFVRSLRLAKARRLLLETDLNISEIAYKTGFNDPAYFSRVFSQEVGCSPTDFRKKELKD